MTPAEQLRQIEDDEGQLRQTVKGFWAVDIGNDAENKEGRKLDLAALDRLVRLAKKGAQLSNEDSDAQARALVEDWLNDKCSVELRSAVNDVQRTWQREQLVKLIADALAQARREEREAICQILIKMFPSENGLHERPV